MTLGTLMVAVSIFIESRITIHSGYLQLLPGFILMGFGMGLVMSPMTTAAMNAVDRTKAGVGVGRVVDEPHGRQHLRRRGDGSDRHNRRAVQAQSEPAATASDATQRDRERVG